MTIEELSSKVADSATLSVSGQDDPEHLSLAALDQVILFMPSDQLVEVQTGILLLNLNQYLREHGFEIPYGWPDSEQDRTVADLLSYNYPHAASPEVGSWRDWVVKMVIILASGEIVKSGANVVKNVSGYDVHKLMIGARYTLGIPIQVTLRIRPFTGAKQYPASSELIDQASLLSISETEQKLMSRTKQIFDPTNKLNPGAFGFI